MKLPALVIFTILILSYVCSYSQTWQTYDSLRSVYQEKLSYDTALVYAEKALISVKEKVGENDTLYADMLNIMRWINDDMGNYKNALDFCLKEKEIRKSLQGEKSIRYSDVLNNLAGLYDIMGDYSAVEPLYIQSMNIRKDLLGEKSVLYGQSMLNLAAFYFSMGEYSKSISLNLEVLEIYKNHYGENSSKYSLVLNNLANDYQNLGNYSEAERLFLISLDIRKDYLGGKNPDYATSLNNLGFLYHTMGRYSNALPYYIKAKNIRKEILGENHELYAQSLNNLAVLYQLMGNYPAAEPLMLETRNILKMILGEKHQYYALVTNNLGQLYREIGNFEASLPLFIESKNIIKETLGEKHPSYATLLNNLAQVYQYLNDYDEAEKLFLQSAEIRKDVFGRNSADYSQSLINIASLYAHMGQYYKAESIYIEGNEICKEIFGEKHPIYITGLNNLASLYDKMDSLSVATPLYIEVMNSRKEVLGSTHPDYAFSLNVCANNLQYSGDFSKAEPMYLECLEIVNNNIYQNFGFLSDNEKEKYLKQVEGAFTNFYSVAFKHLSDYPKITQTVFNNVINLKGLLLKSATAMRVAILNSKDTLLISKYQNWIDLKKEISGIYSTEISKRTKNPEELEQQANSIEKELVKGSQVFSDFERLQSLDWERVRNGLKPGEAAIEFIHFTEGKNGDSTKYCALIITPECLQPEMIRLFEEKEILEIINSSGMNNYKYIDGIYGTQEKMNVSLYKLIWEPIEPYLSDVKTIYYSPDGILHKVSFAALGIDENKYLSDKYNLQQVSSTGKVAIPESVFWDENLTAGLFGGINYSSDTTTVKIWNYLPGTRTETDKIAEVFIKKQIVTNYLFGSTATEDTIKVIADNCNILHISTHGFFYPEPELVIKEENTEEKTDSGYIEFRGGNTGFGLWQFVKNKNPLMRSGLVMAGANNVWNQRYAGEGEDGVLTAQEVTQLDLSKTKLVVLSACETGLGDIKGSEGVYGLQRAFKMAGVKYIIMSLWQVPDKETVEFMETFYSRLLKIKNVRIAFSDTQKLMRKKYDPFYWGSFVLVE